MARQIVTGVDNFQTRLVNDDPETTITIVPSDDGTGFDVYKGQLTQAQERELYSRLSDSDE